MSDYKQLSFIFKQFFLPSLVGNEHYTYTWTNINRPRMMTWIAGPNEIQNLISYQYLVENDPGK